MICARPRRWCDRRYPNGEPAPGSPAALGFDEVTSVVNVGDDGPPLLGVLMRGAELVAYCCVDEPRKLGAFTDEEAAIRAVVRAAGARLRLTEQRLGRRPPSGSTPAPRFRH